MDGSSTVAGIALIFTVGSFWWLNARRGKLVLAVPRSFAFVPGPELRLRLPLTFFNDGAQAIIVADLRVVLDFGGEPRILEWITTRSLLRPEPADGFAFSTPFAVLGRSSREVIAEFGGTVEWEIEPGMRADLRLEVIDDSPDKWRELTAFPWWAPSSMDRRYIAHRNAPRG